MTELLSLSTLVVCFISILIAVRFFGREGLYAYSTVAVIISNIQVLKLTKYTLIDDPVALGTVVFSTTFAVDNILNEYFGENSAKKGVWISFFGYLLFVVAMKIALLHPEISSSECVNMHNEMKMLFSPTIVLFVSSLLSFVVSQFADIFIFSTLKKIFKNRSVSCRSLISMALSTFVDNCVFSLLAWVVLAENPISLSSLWTTYIFVTYFIRLIVAALCVPLVRLSGVFVKADNVQ
ncbi:transporter [Alphaproteobacteria bacterium]|nr:transporter [Alphaproteobacteria bacterium]